MPIARFQMPDGRVARFEVPDGTTPEQAQAAFAQFAGQQGQSHQPQEDPRRAAAEAAIAQYPTAEPKEAGFLESIGNMFSGADRETRAVQELPEIQSSGLLNGLDIPAAKQAALAVALSTMTDPQEIAQTLQAASPDIGIQYDEKGNLLAANNRTGVRAVINKPGLSTLDALQGAAITSAFSPAGRGASVVGGGTLRQAAALGAGSALTQAALEGSHAAAGGDFSKEEVAIAGGLGASAPIAGAALGSIADAAGKVGRVVRSAPASESPLVQAAAANKIPLMTSDVVPPTTFMGRSAQMAGERIPVAGTGGLRATQQEARQKAIQELGERYPTPSPDQIISSLKAQGSRIKQAAGQRYQEIVPKIDAAGPVGYTKTSKAIEDALTELTKPGVLRSSEAINELQQFRQVLGSAPQSYTTLKENRTALREIVESADPAKRSQFGSREKALLSKVYGALSSDMDDAARAALSPRDFARLKEANAIYASEAEKLTKTRLKNVLDKGELTPEVAETLLFSKKRSEVKSLYDSLDSTGRDAARATLIQRAIAKSGGIENISPNKFLNEMSRLQAQTGIIFKGDQKKQLEGLRQVLEATRRASDASVQTATGQQLYAPVSAAAAGSILGFGGSLVAGGTVGVLSRAYESPAVRNALIRIGSAPRSDASKKLALQLARELSAGAQSIRAQATEEQQMPQTP